MIRNPHFTDHALSRCKERRIPTQWVYNTFQQPDTRSPGKKAGTVEITKNFLQRTVTVIFSTNTNGDAVILSVWVEPPFPGTHDSKKKDAYRRYRKGGFFEKLIYIIRKQLGLL